MAIKMQSKTLGPHATSVKINQHYVHNVLHNLCE